MHWQRGHDRGIHESIANLCRRLLTLQGSEHVGVGIETKIVQKELDLLLEKYDLNWR